MQNSKVKRLRHQAQMFGQQFLQSDTGVFDRAFGAALAAIVEAHVPQYRERIYSPLDTLRLFLGQVLSRDGACQDVVGRRLSERIAQDQSHSALSTGGYCAARVRLPLGLASALSEALGAQLESLAPRAWRWQQRSVKIFDGTTVSMPDTASNQQAYPQSREQKSGLGFPVARIGALIGLASGAVLAHQVVACEGKGSGEQSVLGQLLEHVNEGEIVLADALLASWWIIEALRRGRADVLMAQHGARITDFRRGKRLGKCDHIVQWPRPKKPHGMSEEQYARYPAFITLREVKLNAGILVTTLLDARAFPRQELGALYKMRWNIEVDFRTIKDTLQMDVLRCKSAPMIDKEIAVHLLAYNLVRWAMAKAALLSDIGPRMLSFTGAKRVLNAFADQLRRTPSKQINALIGALVCKIATLRLPQRPDRVEPRAKKRRPKKLPLLMLPRQLARERILARRILN